MIASRLQRYSFCLIVFVLLFAQKSDGQCKQLFSGKMFNGYHGPQWMGQGDIDHDGDIDLVTSRSGQLITLVFNDGNGNFEQVNLPGGLAVRDVDVVDLDGDSHLDIIAALEWDNSIVMLFGNGDGTFTDTREIDGLRRAFEIECHDYNQDDLIDITVTTRNGVALLLGAGNREFAPPTIVNGSRQDSTSSWNSLAAADFNGDTFIDLAVQNRKAGYWQVLLGKGTGEFGDPTAFYHGRSEAYWLTTGDINSDSIVDMIVSSRESTVWLGVGDGSFELVNVLDNSTVLGVGLSDFNADGAMDLSLANHPSDGVDIYLGDGDGQFSFSRFLPGPQLNNVADRSWDLALADFNGNGKPDIVSVHDEDIIAHFDLIHPADDVFELPLFGANQSIHNGQFGDFDDDGVLDFILLYPQMGHVYLGTGRGEYLFKQELALGNSSESVGVADFDGDTNSDLAISDYADGNVTIFTGNNDGTFEMAGVIHVGGHADEIATGDFDSDGDCDLAVVSEGAPGSPGYVSLLWNDGFGQFIPEISFNLLGAYEASELLTLDFEQDGDDDLLVETTVTSMMKNNGLGEFQSEWFQSDFRDVLAGDFNHDDVPDLLVRDFDSVSTFLGDGNCGFTETSNQFIGGMFRPVSVLADLNQDGMDDAIFQELEQKNASNFPPVLTVLHGLEDGSFASPSKYSLKHITNNQFLHEIAADDFDGDSDLDLIYIGTRSVTVIPNRCAGFFQIGDVNRDGVVSLLDVPAFIDLLVGGKYQAEADINQDGFVNPLDVSPFVELLAL